MSVLLQLMKFAGIQKLSVINSDQSLTTSNISNLFLNFVASGVDNAHVHNTQSFSLENKTITMITPDNDINMSVYV